MGFVKNEWMRRALVDWGMFRNFRGVYFREWVFGVFGYLLVGFDGKL